MLIGLAGWARSGKDTFADYLVVNKGYTKVAFAEPMREALFRLNPTIEVGNFKLAKLATAVNVFGWEELKTISPDIRGLMQRLGTEVGREMFGMDFWVNQTMKRVAEVDGDCVVSDVRYPNEAQAIRDAGGVVVKIERAGVDAPNGHSSEHALGEFAFDFVIYNDSSLDQFIAKADSTLATMIRYVQER